MNRKGIVRAATLTGIAAALSLTATATATAAPATEPVTTVADLDGDGEIETVTATPAGDDQVISATVQGVPASIRVGADSAAGLEAPRVADLNGDGRAELIVTQSVGANTTHFTTLHFDGGNLSQVVGPDGTPVALAEGGGIAARLGYNCSPEGGGRTFGTVAAEADNLGSPAGELTYSGTRTVYTLRDGALSVRETVPFTGRPATDPLVVADPATCSA
ncbi:FG-GAP repeat domain-containing protein [Amycolatopsis suaedae]|uniref:VCBS repeat-containing protein n=1 Tax=Amycolatopsis suaedae TaxID=2510978 RepID=A0A4Q7J455_9PSEU|nr:VCBS repeat-containing protein [Amycolatopsis suaedae]RZQ61422.1 VCBS repeat-containing protein [Amycolatopsis suaedae]